MKIVNFKKPFWLLSDTHFFHSRLAFDFGLRTEFKTIEEMNERIFNNWNNTISDDDYIFFLGDFVVGAENKYKTAQILYDSLNGKKIFLKGNHDENLEKYTNIPVITGPLEVIYRGKRILLNHEPIMKFEQDLHIYGHTHKKDSWFKPNMVNVSVELVNYTPVHIDDIFRKLDL